MVTLLLPILSKLCKTDVDLLKPQIWGKTTLLQEKRHRIDLLASVHTVLIFESMIWRGFWNSSSWPEEVTSGSNSWYMKLLAILSKFHFVESLRNSERKKNCSEIGIGKFLSVLCNTKSMIEVCYLQVAEITTFAKSVKCSIAYNLHVFWLSPYNSK